LGVDLGTARILLKTKLTYQYRVIRCVAASAFASGDFIGNRNGDKAIQMAATMATFCDKSAVQVLSDTSLNFDSPDAWV
jgi:hypothetical protein